MSPDMDGSVPYSVKNVLWKYATLKETLTNSIMPRVSAKKAEVDAKVSSSAGSIAYCTYVIAFLGAIGKEATGIFTDYQSHIDSTISVIIAAITLIYAISAYLNRRLQGQSTQQESRYKELKGRQADLSSWELRFLVRSPDKYSSAELDSFTNDLERWAGDINHSIMDMEESYVSLLNLDEDNVSERRNKSLEDERIHDNYQQLIRRICDQYGLKP